MLPYLFTLCLIAAVGRKYTLADIPVSLNGVAITKKATELPTFLIRKVASCHLECPFHLMRATPVSIKYDCIQEISVGVSLHLIGLRPGTRDTTHGYTADHE